MSGFKDPTIKAMVDAVDNPKKRGGRLSDLGTCEKCGAKQQKLIPVDGEDFAVYADDKLIIQYVGGKHIKREVCYGCVRGARKVQD